MAQILEERLKSLVFPTINEEKDDEKNQATPQYTTYIIQDSIDLLENFTNDDYEDQPTADVNSILFLEHDLHYNKRLKKLLIKTDALHFIPIFVGGNEQDTNAITTLLRLYRMKQDDNNIKVERVGPIEGNTKKFFLFRPVRNSFINEIYYNVEGQGLELTNIDVNQWLKKLEVIANIKKKINETIIIHIKDWVKTEIDTFYNLIILILQKYKINGLIKETESNDTNLKDLERNFNQRKDGILTQLETLKTAIGSSIDTAFSDYGNQTEVKNIVFTYDVSQITI